MGCHIYVYTDKDARVKGLPFFRVPGLFYDKEYRTREEALAFIDTLRNRTGTCPDTDPKRTETCCSIPCRFSHRFRPSRSQEKVYQSDLDEIEAAIRADDFGWMETG